MSAITSSATDAPSADDLHPGDRICVTADDLGHFVMTFVGWTTDAAGNAMLRFNCPAKIGTMTLYPPAWDNGVSTGTYTRA